MNPSRLRIHLLAPVALACMLAGCGPSVEKSIAFQEQVSRTDSVEESLKDLSRQLSMLDTEFQQVSRMVAEGQGGAGGADSNATKALEARVLRLEQAFQESQKTLTAIQNALEEGKGVRIASAARVAAAPPAEPAQQPQEVNEQVTTAKLKVVGKGSSRAVAAPAPAPSRPAAQPAARSAAQPRPAVRVEQPEPREAARRSGIYHKVTQGQSIDQIASHYKTSVGAIRQANHLPERARLIAGQQIFVPTGR
ncbi:MAG TPA: LysM domain-containing protein [Candidatus Sumerlaeota bacterium]|nr:LysM domain-containing protein [Candidatus Sumerlaeota bacterium]